MSARKRPAAPGKPAEIHADLTDIHLAIGRLERKLDFLGERDNLGSFALAVPSPAAPPQTIVGMLGRAPDNQATIAPQSPSVCERLSNCEIRDGELDARISQLYLRVSDIERALFGDSKL